MNRVYMFLRNLFCGVLALAVIASGRVRQAKRRALHSEVVTAIYFHNPNKRLFARCVRWLAQNSYTFISAAELINILHRGSKPPKGAVWLSFDDGSEELLRGVLPVVRQRRIPVTLFIPSGFVEGDGLFPWVHRNQSADPVVVDAAVRNGTRDCMTIAQVMEVASYPEVTIGSHTVSHAVTPKLTNERAHFEFAESKRALESWTSAPVTCFAYPEGRFDGREGRLLKDCGYEMAATTEASFVTRASDHYFIPRFHVGENIWFPEAICNMVGVWRPVLDPVANFFRYCAGITQGLWDRSATQNASRDEKSA